MHQPPFQLQLQERFTLVTGLAPPDALANNLGELPVGLFAEDPSFSQNFCGKRLLYRGVSGTDGRPAPVEEIGAQQGMRIRTARGFAVRNQEELQAAYKQLGGGVCVIRPLGQMEMGKPLILVDSAEQLTLVDGAAYDWELAVEEHLALDRTKVRGKGGRSRGGVPGGGWDRRERERESGGELSPSSSSPLLSSQSGTSRSFLIPFHGLTVRRDDAQDKVTIGTAVVGLRPSAASKKLLDEAARVAQAVVAHTRPATVGAVHFHAMDNHAVLAGLTVGPFDPYHAGLVFADVFAPGSRTTLWRFSAPADLPASQFYAALSAKGLALSPGQTTRGVFPIAYARGGLGIMVAVAPSPLDAALLQERSAMAIERLGKGLDLDVVPPPAPARRSAVEGMMLIRGADAVFAPAAVPQRNVLVAGGKILGLLDDEQASIFAAVPDVAQIDASGFVLAPGLVDMHVHVQGGGGEVSSALAAAHRFDDKRACADPSSSSDPLPWSLSFSPSTSSLRLPPLLSRASLMTLEVPPRRLAPRRGHQTRSCRRSSVRGSPLSLELRVRTGSRGPWRASSPSAGASPTRASPPTCGPARTPCPLPRSRGPFSRTSPASSRSWAWEKSPYQVMSKRAFASLVSLPFLPRGSLTSRLPVPG